MSSRKKANPNGATIQEFDKKLTETDSYLELLLGQVAQIQKKADEAETADARSKYQGVLAQAKDVTESIKHAIVLLQIAKNAALPEANTGQVKDFTNSASMDPHQGQQGAQGSSVAIPTIQAPSSSASALASGGTPKVVKRREQPAGIELGTEVKEKSSQLLKPDKKSAIPEISYSSSDDDDFFDAEDDDEDEFGSPHSTHRARSPPGALELSLPLTGAAAVPETLQSPLTPTGDDIDFDALYEGEDNEDVDMKSNGSVITHLLSQVRIGMDLTKIVLPTFILERRSLLEMYSDFFAHPDVFVAIADGKTPEDRMVRVLKWYLSSFHAGRKSTIAKKPYNPIIGETFRCHWSPEESSSSRSSAGDPNTDGPLPWVGKNELSFIAEQVKSVIKKTIILLTITNFSQYWIFFFFRSRSHITLLYLPFTLSIRQSESLLTHTFTPSPASLECR